MSIVKKLLYTSYIWSALKACLLGAQFTFPEGTPGFTNNFRQIDNQHRNINCRHIHIPNTNCHLYFPIDGSQPDTIDAGLWSGARNIAQPDDNVVTDWWMRVFGGDRAISSAYGLEKPRRDNAIQMGFNAATGTEAHIIRVNTTIDGTPKNFEQQFWQAFLTISANPVGRVLLYRLLIEIRRVDDTGNGCCEDGIILDLRRNNLRTIEVRYTTNGFSFVYADRCINFDLRNLETLTLHINHNRGGIMGQGEKRPNNVALFHEMLHWFHYLRNFQKVLENKKEDALSFKYAMRCYYGDQSELCIWGANCNAEEISTILGIPNHNKANHLAYIATNSYLSLINMPHDPIVVLNNGVRSYIPNSERFLNGEDLSENAYRCSRGLHMRFGHTDKTANLIDILNPPLRYQLAHIVAVECYTEITGQQPINWRFRAGEAIKR